jgi:hypothetical protein
MNAKSSPFVLTKFDRVNIISEESPRAAEILAEYGIHCVGCYFSEEDTLETGGELHGMSEEEIDEMVEEINAQLEKEWREKNK